MPIGFTVEPRSTYILGCMRMCASVQSPFHFHTFTFLINPILIFCGIYHVNMISVLEIFEYIYFFLPAWGHYINYALTCLATVWQWSEIRSGHCLAASWLVIKLTGEQVGVSGENQHCCPKRIEVMIDHCGALVFLFVLACDKLALQVLPSYSTVLLAGIGVAHHKLNFLLTNPRGYLSLRFT